MPRNFRQSIATVNLAVDTVTAHLNGGFLRIFAGEQPDSPDDPITDQRLLAELRFADPAFEPAVDGLATANPLPGGTIRATGSGRATWFRALRADGITPVFDGSCGLLDSESDLTLVQDDRFIAGVTKIPLAEVGLSFRMPSGEGEGG